MLLITLDIAIDEPNSSCTCNPCRRDKDLAGCIDALADFDGQRVGITTRAAFLALNSKHGQAESGSSEQFEEIFPTAHQIGKEIAQSDAFADVCSQPIDPVAAKDEPDLEGAEPSP